MNAEDVAAFMRDDEDVEEGDARVHNPYFQGNPPATGAAARPGPSKAGPAKKVPPKKSGAANKGRPMPPAPPKVQSNNNNNNNSSGLSSADVRNMMLRDDEEPVDVGGNRFEPLSSGIEDRVVDDVMVEEEPKKRSFVVPEGVAKGGGMEWVRVVGTEERAENAEVHARTFVAYVLEADRGEGPYLIYRRFRQFEDLHRMCKRHGMRVPQLPAKEWTSLFGLKGVDPKIVQERVPQLHEWLKQVLQLPGAQQFETLQLWLSPVQIGDLKPKQYAQMLK